MGEAGSWIVALVAFAALVAPSLARADPWLGSGTDAGRRGEAGDVVRIEDVAFALPIDSLLAVNPLLLDRTAVIARDLGEGAELMAVDLDTAQARSLIGVRDFWGMASDGESIFVAADSSLAAVSLDGTRIWEVETGGACVEPAVSGGLVLVACTERRFGAGAFALAISAASGDVAWEWRKTAVEEARGRLGQVAPGVVPAAPLPTEAQQGSSEFSRAQGVSVVEGLVVLSILDESGATVGGPSFNSRGRQASVYALTLAGELAWARNMTFSASRYAEAGDASRPDPSLFVPGVATGDAGGVLARLDDLELMNLAHGGTVAHRTIGERDASRLQLGAGLAIAGGSYYATSAQSLYRLSPTDLEVLNVTTFPAGSNEHWSGDGLVVTSGLVLGLSFLSEPVTTSTLGAAKLGWLVRALDASTLEPRWSVESETPLAFSVGEGVLAIAPDGGPLVVRGVTNASVSPRAVVHETRGRPVVIDLSSTPPGVSGAPSSFRVLWGDGADSGWESSPVLSHAYARPGSYTVSVGARNSANETGWSTVTVESLAPTSRPWGIFVLSGFAVLVALAGGAAARLRRRRRAAVPRSPAPTPPAKPAPGATFLGKYVVERALGTGAFGRAWLATHVALKRRVVIKELHAEWATVPEARARFAREAQILASLDHPNVTRVYDAEIVGAAWYIVMEFVDGGSLAERERSPSAQYAVQVLRGVLDGLAHVHDHGVVHRDLKPSNVLLTRSGMPKVADFGIARVADSSATVLTAAGGSPPGTPLYMAPEQVLGAAGDVRSDLYAAAVIFHHLASGGFYLGAMPPDAAALARRILDQPPVPVAGLSPAVAAWLARGLAKDPEARFGTAREMREALDRAFT